MFSGYATTIRSKPAKAKKRIVKRKGERGKGREGDRHGGREIDRVRLERER